MWTILPAPNIPLLALGTIAAEYAPYALVMLAVLVMFAFAVPAGSVRKASLAACALAIALEARPLLEVPGVVAASDAAVAALGGDPPAPGATADRAPFDPLWALHAGRSRRARIERVASVAFDGIILHPAIYRDSEGTRPTVFLLYGGAWRFGSPANERGFSRELARLGYTAIALDYRHVPAAHFPVQRDDVRAELGYFAAHADAFGVDPDRVAFFGESAGAELALLAAYRTRDLHVRGVAAWYAPLDLAAGYRSPPVPDPADVRAILRAYLGATPQQLPAAYAAASPRTFVRPGLPPTLLVGGVRDELVEIRFARAMTHALASAGDPVAEIDLPWANHGFAALPAGLGSQLGRFYTERFFARTLR